MNCPKCNEPMTHQGKPDIIYKHKIVGTPKTIAADTTSALAVGLEYERNVYFCAKDDISVVTEVPFSSPSRQDSARPEMISVQREIKGNFLARQMREKPLTPGRQRELEDFKAFCEKESITIGDSFMEYGPGDLQMEQRPLLQNAIAASKGNMLVVAGLDTLSSKTSVLKSIFEECERQGVELKILRGPKTAEQLLSLMDSPDYQ
jgi:hypothetical protein